MGYYRAGCDVTGVDIKPQPHYPFDFCLGDALTASLGGYDAIHASPPCQPYSAYRRRGHGVGDRYPDLIANVRERLVSAGVPYVIENVPGSPLVSPVMLCGSAFGLDVRRHRLFESNFYLLAPGCDHGWQTPRFRQATNRRGLRRTVEIGVWRIPLDVQQRAMGIDWMTLLELSQAIPPAYTKHMGRQIVAIIRRQHADAA